MSAEAKKIEAKPLGALQRIDALEQSIRSLLPGIVDNVTRVQEQLSATIEVLNAIMEVVGVADVTAQVAAARTKRIEEMVKQLRVYVEKEVSEGRLAKAETINDDSLVIAREFDPEGNVVVPGRIQLHFSKFTADGQALIRGKKAGDSMDLPNKGKLEILEVYARATPAPKLEAVPTQADCPVCDVPSKAEPAPA